jgi:hypothetical protein
MNHVNFLQQRQSCLVPTGNEPCYTFLMRQKNPDRSPPPTRVPHYAPPRSQRFWTLPKIVIAAIVIAGLIALAIWWLV